ncbi:hypothetical protein AAG570_001425 [Ranatra chinensis]|uniref:Uncharacterized protein n=1 Tax=Ranatra chinensis TaxID=642074 RepID=A0ABD0YDR6_9HEMI
MAFKRRFNVCPRYRCDELSVEGEGHISKKSKKRSDPKSPGDSPPPPSKVAAPGTPPDGNTREYGSHKIGSNGHRIHIRHVIHNYPLSTRLISEDDTFLHFSRDEKQTYCHYLSFRYG